MLSDILEKYLNQILFLAGVVGQLVTLIMTLKNSYEDQPFRFLVIIIISYIFFLIISLAVLLKRSKLSNDDSLAKSTIKGTVFYYSLRARIAITIIILIFSFISFFAIFKIVTGRVVNISSQSQATKSFALEQAINAYIGVNFRYIDEIVRAVKDIPFNNICYASDKKMEDRVDKKITFQSPAYFFDLKEYTKYQPRSLFDSLIKIDNIERPGGGFFAIVNEKRKIPYARIIDPIKIMLDAFLGDACAFNLNVRAINIADKDSVMIDAIIVNVISYETLPKYELRCIKPFGREVVYYVEIDDPKVSNTNLFKAQYFISQKKKDDFGNYEVEMGHPEQVGIRVNARRPGIYKFEIEILASHKGKKQKITLPTKYEFLFDDKK